MKISAITHLPKPISTSKNNKLQKTKLTYQTDTVSFARKRMKDDKKPSKTEAYYNQYIAPIQQETEELYKETCRIGYKTQSITKKNLKLNTEISMNKFLHSNVLTNENLEEFWPILNLANEIKINKNSFNMILNMSEKDWYKNNPEFNTEIENAKKAFEKNDTISSLIKFDKKCQKTFETLAEKLEEININNIAPELAKKIETADIQNKNALIYSFHNPYPECKKIEKLIEKLKTNEFLTPYEKVEITEKIYKNTNTILNSYDIFKNQIPEIKDFVEKSNKSEPLPSIVDMENIYKKMNSLINEYSKQYTDEIKKYYKKEYIEKNIKIDTYNMKKEIWKQDKILRNLHKLINNIKTKQYSEMNNFIIANWQTKHKN